MEWVGFGELWGWKLSTQSGNTVLWPCANFTKALLIVSRVSAAFAELRVKSSANHLLKL